MMSARCCYRWFERLVLTAVVCNALAFCRQAAAADPALEDPAVDLTPQLRLEAGGPTAYVTSLAFNPAADSISWPTAPMGARIDIDDKDALWAVLDEH